jgi:two-component system, chemotaxis family, response regulator Rcp1
MASRPASLQSQTMQPIEVLLVEDNPGDVRLAVEVLKDGKFLNHLSVMEDGISALQYLRQRAGSAAKFSVK